MKTKPKVIVICGPTASGKTGLSVKLAQAMNGEIISCDSMQIYKDMTIGTAKVTEEEMQGIQHYLIDFVSPEERYSVADFQKDSEKAISKILAKRKTPIVVGGTGLYVDTLVYHIQYPEIETDLTYRQQLEKMIEEQGLEALYQKAKEIDLQATEKISNNDQKRIMRILEIYHQTGKTKTQLEIESRREEPPYEYLMYAIDMDREKLYDRINQRVDIMMEQGLVEEVQELLRKYKNFPTAMQGLGYKEVVPYLQGDITKEEMIENLKQETRRYAKRQLTWFRKNKEIKWLDGLAPAEENIQRILEDYEEAEAEKKI
ncbi:MAG: tRNA (adenosine(37)-N6)-dimethylallyltransferase MiaA [Clostridia bacterium]|nr:tRNA (adenosine(37)-N6)-dimethylallyltransferase MiaA [Clostridia bacterium]